MEISIVITALNSEGERAEPCGEPVVSDWVWVRFYPFKCNFSFSIV